MSQRITRTLIDDLDGKRADETVTFRYNGTEYEIDLSRKNAAALKKAFAPFVAHARKAPAGNHRPATRRTKSKRQQAQGIRAWAKGQGIPVNERGRIPATVIAQYRAGQ